MAGFSRECPMSAIHLHAAILMVAGTALSSPAIAQQVLSEKQISLPLAHDIAMTAVEECRKGGFRVAAVVVDRAGRIKFIARDDGAGPHTIEASQRKAYTAAVFRVTTTAFAERLQKNPAAAPLTQLDNVTTLH